MKLTMWPFRGHPRNGLHFFLTYYEANHVAIAFRTVIATLMMTVHVFLLSPFISFPKYTFTYIQEYFQRFTTCLVTCLHLIDNLHEV